MLDFLRISTKSPKRGVVEIFPSFKITKSKDLMVRGGDFYAIWDEDSKLWSTDEDVAIRLIDKELDIYREEHAGEFDSTVKVLYMWDADSGMIDKWHKYVQKQCRDSYHLLDEKVIFSNHKDYSKKDYATKKLPYPLEEGDISSYDELMNCLYKPEERHKIEWSVGSIINGDSKKIQKFLVLYGSAGTGKSTVLNIIQDMFDGYYSVFDAKALGQANNSFAIESLKSNPLVAIQHDGDLSRIEDNTRLNSIVSHELLTVNEKFKSAYSNKFRSFLIIGTNKPVKITDAKSGILRRLIDVSPTGNTIPLKKYNMLVNRIKFELGAIAYHCLQVYEEDKDYYNDYIPVSMLGASNDFYNFILEYYEVFLEKDGTTLSDAWEMYDAYCKDARVTYPYQRRVVKEELKNYFKDFYERAIDETTGLRVRNVYKGFISSKFEYSMGQDKERYISAISLDSTVSIFDEECKDCIAQYASEKETPLHKWDNVDTKLKDIDTSKLHYVRVPENHIVIDFDIKNSKGVKDFKKNLEAASKWPPTYAELSKGGNGIHLHYIYNGDPNRLENLYDKDIEIKVFTGKSSLRRKLTFCNDKPIAQINGAGLPMKGDKKMVNADTIKSEQGLVNMIKRCLNKENHGHTKPEVDFIYHILEEAYAGDLAYDVSEMRPAVLAFAANSSNQSDYCVKLVNKMHFKSEDKIATEPPVYKNDVIIFFDIEVFPNLFVIVWKKEGESTPVKMINPTPAEVQELCKYKLIGFNCRRYDNHIMYARAYRSFSIGELYNLSQRIINGGENAYFSNAYNLSYTDIYDFSSKKQSLKKFEIELGIHHQELGLPWDEPVDEDKWYLVADYCINDVLATEAVFNARKGDWLARQILTDICKTSSIPATVNDTTNSLTTKIIFGNERHPKLVYTDLSTGEQS